MWLPPVLRILRAFPMGLLVCASVAARPPRKTPELTFDGGIEFADGLQIA